MQILNREPLVDSFQRQISYLRISVTDRCNLRCRYCAPFVPKRVPEADLLALDEIHRLVRIGTRLGIRKLRLTGGEPLVREGVVGLIERLAGLDGIEDVSLTTNGTLISRYGTALRQAGLRRLNISLDTLDRKKFREIAGADDFASVWDGIMTAVDLGFSPIKINTVVMKGVNDDEIEALAALATRYPFHVRFIEYMPIGTPPHLAHRHFMPIDAIKARVERVGRLIPQIGGRGDGPAQRFRLEGAAGEIGLIGSMSAHFCATCNRLRLTGTGHLRPCLLADHQENVIDPLRRGASDEAIEAIFRGVVAQKGRAHRLRFDSERSLHTQMVSIGG